MFKKINNNVGKHIPILCLGFSFSYLQSCKAAKVPTHSRFPDSTGYSRTLRSGGHRRFFTPHSPATLHSSLTGGHLSPSSASLTRRRSPFVQVPTQQHSNRFSNSTSVFVPLTRIPFDHFMWFYFSLEFHLAISHRYTSFSLM